MRKRTIFILLLFALLPFTAWSQQKNYYGQHVSIKRNGGDSIQYDFSNCPYLKPIVKDGKIVWDFLEYVDKNKDGKIEGEEESQLEVIFSFDEVEEIDFRSFEYDETESRKALVEFYYAMDGDNWPEEYKENWCSDKPIWEWYGVNQVGGITELPWVETLDVQSLYLDNPSQIPDCISRMGPIQFLWLSGNNFNGSIPEFLGWNYSLMHLELGNNNLTGPLPASFYNLSKMPRFWALGLESNKLDGSLPEDLILSLMDKIPGTNLSMINNSYTGKVPESISGHPEFMNFWPAILPQEGEGLDLTGLKIPAPDITFKDINGYSINTSDIYKKNKYTLLYHWGWWCPYSGALNEKLVPAYNAYKDKGFEVIGFHEGQDDELQEFLNSNDIPWINSFYDDWTWDENDLSNDNVDIFFRGGIPHIFLVDQNGIIVFNDLIDENGHWSGGSNRENLFSFLEHELGPIEYGFYTSTDYSQDSVVTTLQTATVGQGFDLVFVGEGFTDNDISDGTFDERMNEALDQFFAYEPYTSLRDRFNVYSVKAVSPNAEFLGSNVKHAIDEDPAKALEYALKVPNLRPDCPMHVLVIYNKNSGGRSYCNMYEDDSFVCFAMDGVSTVLNHEAGGHGIGKLLDEYVEKGNEDLTLSDEKKAYLETVWNNLGWGANVEWRSDPLEIKWAGFMNDSRYDTESIGIYEGSYLYKYGAYRPTLNSMMRYNDMPFNAPSREAIYKRVMMESEGGNWTYDYETFVEFDAAGRNQYNSNLQNAPMRSVSRDGNRIDDSSINQLTAPPVFIKGTWRDALKK